MSRIDAVVPVKPLGRALLRHATRERRWSALIDGHDQFDPQSAGSSALSGLLWIRCHTATEAMRSADLLLRDGNLPLAKGDEHFRTGIDLA